MKKCGGKLRSITLLGDMMHVTQESTQNGHRDSAGVIAPAPALFGAGLIIGLVLHGLYPIAVAATTSGIRLIVSVVLIVIGLLFSIAVMRVFRTAGTPVAARRTTTRLISRGPYRYTRNPDYVGHTLLYLGFAVMLNTWWPIFLLPLVLLVVHYGVIRREERYLETKFGDEYRDYMARVRRWL